MCHTSTTPSKPRLHQRPQPLLPTRDTHCRFHNTQPCTGWSLTAHVMPTLPYFILPPMSHRTAGKFFLSWCFLGSACIQQTARAYGLSVVQAGNIYTGHEPASYIMFKAAASTSSAILLHCNRHNQSALHLHLMVFTHILESCVASITKLRRG